MASRATTRNAVQQKKDRFLGTYAETGNISRSAELSRISRSQHYEWLESDPAYARRFADAEEIAVDSLEEEARRRAVIGTDRPVFYKGEAVGAVREYSDTLLIFLLKGARPAKYRDRVSFDGSVTHHVESELDREISDILQQMAGLSENAEKGARSPASGEG